MRKEVDEKNSDYGFSNYGSIDKVIQREVWVEHEFNIKKDLGPNL